MADEIDLGDLEPISVRYRIGGRPYVLKEASGDAACKWRNFQLKCVKMEGGKAVSVEGTADGEPKLVALCLFAVSDAGTEVPVPEQVVRSWPQRVQKALFEKAKEIGQLEERPSSMEERMTALAQQLAEARGGDVEMERKLAEVRAKALDIRAVSSKNSRSGTHAGSS